MSVELLSAAALITANAELRAALDVAMAENDRRREVVEQIEADYAVLRAVTRRCFTEHGSEQSLLDLMHLASSDNHPGAALTIRFNRAKAVVEAARSHDWGNVEDALHAYDAPLRGDTT